MFRLALVSALLFAFAVPSYAQPVAPVATMSVAAPVTAGTASDVSTEPETIVQTKVATPVAAMSAAPVSAPSVPVPAKTPTNWAAIITAIGMAITALISLLAGLGYMKWTKDARVQTILKATKKGTEAFLAYAEKSPALWDDAVAKILDNTNAVLLACGQDPLNSSEANTAKTLAESYKNVANAPIATPSADAR
jgi:mannitol-specific phosphotransferase system IIBC component